MTQYKILLVDDDKDLLKMLKLYFDKKGYLVFQAENGIEALKKIETEPDIILLDINMPRLDGLSLCKLIRDKVSCPILFLTAKIQEQDRINGLLSGGDDYIVKPFSLKELEARIIAHLKREELHGQKAKIRFFGELGIDFAGRTVTWGEEEIEFTKMEYEIIEFLAGNAGYVYDKEMIYERVCAYEGEGDSRVVTELIRRIRNKLSKYSEREWIETVWGCGYKWNK